MYSPWLDYIFSTCPWIVTSQNILYLQNTGPILSVQQKLQAENTSCSWNSSGSLTWHRYIIIYCRRCTCWDICVRIAAEM